MESYKNNIHRKLIIKHHKDLSWHSEPSKMDEIGKEHLDQESNLVLCQMKVQILSLKANLGILREDTCKCSSDASDGTKDIEAFKKTVATISQDIVGLFTLISVLHDKDEQPLRDFQASQDISVAFFGLFWPHLFKEIERIQSTVEEMQKAQNHPTSSLLTLVMCRHLIFDLAKLEGDLHAHSEAVLSGRTSIKQKEHIRSEQRRMSLQTVSPDLKGPKRRLSYDEGQHRGFFAGLMSLWRRRRSMTSPRQQRRTGVPSTIQEYQTGPQNERTLA